MNGFRLRFAGVGAFYKSMLQTENASLNRPGPLGPAAQLLVKDQEPLLAPADMPAHEAVEMMFDNKFSQVPVVDSSNRIIGVISWRSFGKRLADLKGLGGGASPVELPVAEFMEAPVFVDPEAWIDTQTDWSNFDYVLVGTPEKLLGVLSITDIVCRFNSFSEVFVLLYEIECELRGLIRDICKGSLPSLTKSLSFPQGHRAPDNVEDIGFSDYKWFICSKANWAVFNRVFGTSRELLESDFDEVISLRSKILSLNIEIQPRDIDRLRRFLSKIRFDRSSFLSKERDAVTQAKRQQLAGEVTNDSTA